MNVPGNRCSLEELVELVARLRSDVGCPWDRAQTHRSLLPYLIEEAYEVQEAMKRGSAQAQCSELGDLLFHIVIHAQIAHESGHYDMEQVVRGIIAKMVRRHPNLFGPPARGGKREAPSGGCQQGPGPGGSRNSGAQPGSSAWWEAQKALERGDDSSSLDGIPPTLPALLRAARVGEKVSRVGFDWPDLQGVRHKVDEELAELDEAVASGRAQAIAHEYGDAMLALANMGRFLGLCPEDALRAASVRFEKRFRRLEALAERRGLSLHEEPLDVLEELWTEAKQMEAGQFPSGNCSHRRSGPFLRQAHPGKRLK